MQAVTGRLFRFCAVLCPSIQDAQDLFQNTMVTALEKLAQLNDPQAFYAWIYQIARRQFADQCRSSRRIVYMPGIEGELERQLGDSADLDQVLHLRQLLLRLPPGERFLLYLVEVEQYTYEEVAKITNRTHASVRSQIFRARRELMKISAETTRPFALPQRLSSKAG